MPSVKLVGAINTQTADLRNAEAVHIISTEPSVIRAADKEIDELAAIIATSISQYTKLVSSEQEKGLLQKFESEYGKYLFIQKELLTLSEENKNVEARAIFLDKSLKAYNNYSNTLLELAELNKSEADKASEYGDVLYKESVTIMIVMTVVVLVIIFLAAFTITRSLTKPIGIIQDAMTRLSGGDLTINIEDQGSNELGVLAQHVNKTVLKLSEIVSSLLSVADNVASSSIALASTMTQASASAIRS